MKLISFAGVRLIGRVGFVFLALDALAGCSAIEVGLGLRMRLDKAPVTAISATLFPDPGLAPGKSGRLIITATTSDAKQLVTVGAGHGNVLFDSFTFTATTVTVNKKGVVSLAADPRVSVGAMPRIQIVVVGHPDVSADLSIPVRYDVAFVADFAGKPGFKASTVWTAAQAAVAATVRSILAIRPPARPPAAKAETEPMATVATATRVKREKRSMYG